MPLHDHFAEPLSLERPWEGIHSCWATTIAQQLNDTLLPGEFVALPQVRRGAAVEIDVATMQQKPIVAAHEPTLVRSPAWSIPIVWNELDLFEIRVIKQEGRPKLVSAIELVSPANKDRPSHRRAFAGKCAGYLRQGVSLIVVDVVTERRGSLHLELREMLELNGSAPFDADLYAVAYRTIENGLENRLEIWPEPLAVGSPLPSLPLWLSDILAVTLDLEASYQAACRSLRIA